MLFPKENAVKHKGYLRLVASLPCIRCGIQGYSQAAHPPPTGKGRKEDDRKCFPLCCTRPDNPGCHFQFDQYQLFPREKAVRKAEEWGRDTRLLIIRAGMWPEKLPRLLEH